MSQIEVAKPRVMWFKMEQYRDMGNKYMNTMKSLVIAMFDKYNIEGMYFNVLFNCGSELKAKKLLTKQQVITELEKIEMLSTVKINYNE